MSKIGLKANLKDITIDNKGNITVSFSVLGVNRYKFEQLSHELQNMAEEANDGLKIVVDKYRKRRTLTQNDSLWYLCDELAKVMHTTKEEIYRDYIVKLGRFETVPVKKEALKFWTKSWESKGIGWQCVNPRESKIEGYMNVDCYFGTSVYDTKEMARILEEVIKDCKEHNIEWQPYVDRMEE